MIRRELRLGELLATLIDTGYLECDVTDPEGKLIAKAMSPPFTSASR